MELTIRVVGWFERRHAPIVREIIAKEGFPFEICDYGKPISSLNTWIADSQEFQKMLDKFWEMFRERKRDEEPCLPSPHI